MMVMKATRGSTFPFGSSYWTQTNTLNTSDNRNDADAKYDTFNYYQASDFLAILTDLNNGGQASGGRHWSWYTPNVNMTVLSRFSHSSRLMNLHGESMWQGSGFSSQGGTNGMDLLQSIRWSLICTRWGFGWNNEGGPGSNDVIRWYRNGP